MTRVQVEEQLGIAPIESKRVQGREVCDVKEAARVLSVSRVTIHQYLLQGKLEYLVMPGSGFRKPLVRSVRALLRKVAKHNQSN